MELKTTYQEVLTRFPIQMEEVLEKLSNSKSKYRNVTPGKLQWFYQWTSKAYLNSFQEVLGGTAKIQTPDLLGLGFIFQDGKNWIPLSGEQRALFEIKRTKVSLLAKIGQCRPTSTSQMKVPREITQIIRLKHQQIVEEEARINNLKPVERSQEIQVLLKQLTKKGSWSTYDR